MQALLNRIEAVSEFEVFGRVKSVKGLSVEIVGPIFTMGVGSRLEIARPHMSNVLCEIVGFTQDSAIALPFGDLIGVQQGAKAFVKSSNYLVYPSSAWLGRVINALGEPLDGKGPLPHGEAAYAIRSAPPPAHERSRVGEPIDLGVKTLNTFLTCCNGQRMGIFAGSGVGKSSCFRCWRKTRPAMFQ